MAGALLRPECRRSAVPPRTHSLPSGVDTVSRVSARFNSIPGPSDNRFQPSAVFAGVVATLLVSLAAAGLVAIVVYATPITERTASTFLFALGLASLGVGAGYAAHVARGMGWAHGLVVGLAYVALSLLLQPLLFPGAWTLGGTVQRLVLGMIAGTLGGVFGVNL